MELPGLPPGSREVHFKVLKEDWSKYEILDGKATVWVRAILMKLFTDGKGNYAVATQTVANAFFDDELKKKPTTRDWTPQDLATGGKQVEYQPIHEPFNEYLISGKQAKVIKIKCIATRVRYHPDKANQTGDPIANVDSQVVVSPAEDAVGFVQP